MNSIETLITNALKCVKNPSTLETAVGYGERVFLLYKLLKYVKKILDETFPVYLKTCSSGISNSRKIAPAILEQRSKRAKEVKDKIEELRGAINQCIGTLERPNIESDIHLCSHYLDMFRSKDVSKIMPQGFRDSVLNTAAKTTFIELLGDSLVKEIYRHYRLDRVGRYRFQDFQALFIGMLAQMRPTDLSEQMVEEFKRVGIKLSTTNQIRDITTEGVTTPLKRYLRVFARDLALLKAHQSLDAYSKGNPFIKDMFRFAYIERDMLDLALPFTRYPECPLIEGALYECMEGTKYKSYQICPLRHAERVYALGLVPIEHDSSPTLRLIITDSGNPALDVQTSKNLLAQLAAKTLDKSVNRMISVEICVPAMAADSTVLTHLLNGLKELQNVHPSNVSLYFWGPLAMSENASVALRACITKLNITQFSLRYFLFSNQTFTAPAIPNLKSFYSKNGAIPNNFSVSIFYLRRDRDSMNGTRAKRYFSLVDEYKQGNETYLNRLVTNHPEDANKLTVVVDGYRKQSTIVQNFDEIATLLTPPPPPPGYLDMLYSGIGTAYSTASYYIPSYFKSS